MQHLSRVPKGAKEFWGLLKIPPATWASLRLSRNCGPLLLVVLQREAKETNRVGGPRFSGLSSDLLKVELHISSGLHPSQRHTKPSKKPKKLRNRLAGSHQVLRNQPELSALRFTPRARIISFSPARPAPPPAPSGHPPERLGGRVSVAYAGSAFRTLLFGLERTTERGKPGKPYFC